MKTTPTRAVLFNGPASSGKDDAINHLLATGWDFTRRECKDHLHKLTQSLFCISPVKYWGIYNNRAAKEEPNPHFRVTLQSDNLIKLGEALSVRISDIMYRSPLRVLVDKTGSRKGESIMTVQLNLSIREAVIYVSEVLCKPTHGEEYFGIVRAGSVVLGEEDIIDGSASAFVVGGEVVCDEVPPLIDRLGEENVLLIRVHREGYTFKGDSRRYIPDGVVPNTVDVYNDSTLGEYFRKVKVEVSRFYNFK